MRNSALTFGTSMALVAASFGGPVCRANEKNLPDSPVPATSRSDRRAEHSMPPSLAIPQQFAAKTHALADTSPIKRSSGSEHRFWNRENVALFSFVGASRALDYSSTLNMRRRGRQEILLTNDIVDNRPAFAAIEAGGTAVSIGASYLFHRYRHHRLERWTSIIHGSLTTTGAVRNYCLKTEHPSTTP